MASGWLTDELAELDALASQDARVAPGLAGLGAQFAALARFVEVYPRLRNEVLAARQQLPVAQHAVERMRKELEAVKKQLGAVQAAAIA